MYCTVIVIVCKGKLLQFLVADGSHVDAGQAYAEMEIMKMVQTLRVPAAGTIALSSKRAAGSQLERGTELGTLKLDNETDVRKVCCSHARVDPVSNLAISSTNTIRLSHFRLLHSVSTVYALFMYSLFSDMRVSSTSTVQCFTLPLAAAFCFVLLCM